MSTKYYEEREYYLKEYERTNGMVSSFSHI